MASLVSYGACQTACNAAVVACYSAAGLTFGAAFTAGLPAAAVTCSEAQAACMTVCATKFLAEGGAEVSASGGLLAPALALGGIALVIWGRRRNRR